VRRVEHARLTVDLDIGHRLEERDHRVLGLLVTLGGGGLEGRADLRVSKVVWLSALASVVAAGTECVVMEGSGDLSIGEVEGFGVRDRLKGKAAKDRGVLEHGLLVMGGEGSEKGGMACFEDLGASIALADEGGVFVVNGEAEKGSNEAVRGSCRSGSRFRSDLLEGEDAETSEAGRKGDDLRVGGERAEGRAKDEEGMLKMLVKVVPTAGQVVRPKAALEMAQVVLDALPEEEKSGLEREGGKLLKETDLFVNLLLQEGSPELG
jgi:hypothetical protein